MTNNQPVEVLPLEEALNQGPVFTTQNRDLRTDLTLHNEHCLNPDDNDLDHAYELNVTNIRVVEGRVTADVKVGRYKDVSTQKGRFTVIKNTPVWEKTIENLVFLELKRRGYKVAIGKLDNQEIDFIAEKPKKKIYIQVCYLLNSEATIKREISGFEKKV